MIDREALKIKSGGQQATATPEEQQERMESLRTQGRKGCKAVRINMAFKPQVHEYVKTLASATGKNMTEVTNSIIMQHMQEHRETYDKAKALIAEFGLNNG